MTDAPEPIDFESLLQLALRRANDPESHVERDAVTFHPSQIARCERRAYCSKLGLDDQTDILGIFQTGTLIHEFLEEWLATEPHVDQEVAVEHRPAGDAIRFVGQADVHDPETGAVYDFKTRNGWYNFDPPTQRHLDQIYVYMAALGADRGQVVYLSKSDLEVRTWPEDGFFEFDQERFDAIVAKARRISQAIVKDGFPETASDIPFEPCGCYFCQQETLVEELQEDADGE